MAGNTAPEIDPLATYDSRPAVSFDPSKEHGHGMGEWAILTVDGYVDTVQRKDDNKQPMVYSDTGKPMMSFVLPVVEDGEDRALWGKVPGGPLTALKAAQAKLQADLGDKERRIRPGDTLAIRWASNNTSVAPKMGNYPKVFEAVIKPGELPKAEGNTSADPFASTPAAQPAAQQPAPQPAPAQPVPVTPAPQVGGDPFGAPPAGETRTPAQPSQPAGDPFGAPAAQQPAAAPATQGDPFGNPSSEAPPF